MNIEDVEYKNQENVKEPFKAIFDKQLELINKYKDIEKLPDFPFNLDVAENQKLIKDFKQRGMEEVAESIEGFRKKEFDHFKEELIDGLHFFVEMNILVGKKWDDFKYYNYRVNPKPSLQSIYYHTGELTEKYGLLMNTLKNKPWKQTQIATDQAKFFKLLKEAFEFYVKFMHYCGLSYDEIFNLYHKKHYVNEFRIRTKY
jgi:hypothetical protein